MNNFLPQGIRGLGDKGIRGLGDALCPMLEEERENGRVGEWVSVSLAQMNNFLPQGIRR